MATAQVARGGRDVFTYGPKEIGLSAPCHIDKTAEVLREALAWVVKLQNKKTGVSGTSYTQRLQKILHAAPDALGECIRPEWYQEYSSWLMELDTAVAYAYLTELEPALKDILRKAPGEPHWRKVPWAQVATWFKEYSEWLESLQQFIPSGPELTLEERVVQLETQLKEAVEAHERLQVRFSQTQRGGAGARN